ncbi:MAG: amidohydrolase family protein [Hyphomicrobiales bacterium]
MVAPFGYADGALRSTFLMWCAVNRVTGSGRVAGPEQRVSVEQALRGVTIEAAYSLKLEDEIGTITPGKRGNFTILSDNPLTVDPMKIRDISVWGTVMEGRVLPADETKKKASLDPPQRAEGDLEFGRAAMAHVFKVSHSHL